VDELKQHLFAEPGGARPLIKWAGGKSKLLAQLSALMPRDVRQGFGGRLVEPFVGGAAMFLWLSPRDALLADANPELIGLYDAARNHLDTFTAALDRYQELEHDEGVYYKQRGTRPSDPVERAAWLVYLNRNCFNGLYRLNRRGEFNVPFGRYRSKPRLYDPDNLRAVHEALLSAQLMHAGFGETLAAVEPDDFVYLDPPYYPRSETSSFTGYTGAGFGHEDQLQLRDAMLAAHERTDGRARMLSNSSAPALLDLYTPYSDVFRIERVTAMRAVGATRSSRGTVEEVAILNYDVTEQGATC
jgi:DNA adenine methylase